MIESTETGTRCISVVVIGRKWFQKSYGNTYHTAQIIIDGATVHKTPLTYGYGEQYMQSAADWLEDNGYMPGREHYPHGGAEMLPMYFRRHNVGVTYEALDVRRERDA